MGEATRVGPQLGAFQNLRRGMRIILFSSEPVRIVKHTPQPRVRGSWTEEGRSQDTGGACDGGRGPAVGRWLDLLVWTQDWR